MPEPASRPAAAAALPSTRRTLLASPALLLGRRALAWPDRPVRLVVAFPPGSGTDVLGRVLAVGLQQQLGQPVVVDNRPGGNGTVGTQSAAMAAPDGDTLLIISTSAASINPHTIKRLPYDPVRDFTPVGGIAEEPYLLAVPPDGPDRDLAGLVERARKNPGSVTQSYGNAAGLVMGSMLASMAGVSLSPVPYRGGAEALTDVSVGRIDLNFADVGPALAQRNGGRVRLVAQTLDRTFPLAPEIPTVSSVVPGYDVNVWFGLAAPAATPPEVVGRANAALNAALADPDTAGKLAQLGFIPFRTTPGEFGQYVRRQLAVWGERVALAKIEAQ